MSIALVLAAALATQVPDGPIATGVVAPTEAAEAQREREAIAYAFPLPPGAPADDYAFVGYCAGLVGGHVEIGGSFTGADEELLRLGRLELQDFQSALRAGAASRTPAQVAAAQAGRETAMERWRPYLENPSAAERQMAFDVFNGLPGRCEHAARRVREGITDAPATLEQVGLNPEDVLPPAALEAAAPAAPPVPTDPDAPMATAQSQ